MQRFLPPGSWYRWRPEFAGFRARSAESLYETSPLRTEFTARSRAAAQAAEIVALFPFAARAAFVPACLRTLLALCSSLRPFLPCIEAAWSMRASAVPNFPVTLVGMVSPPHAGLMRAASMRQRAVVHGSVVVVEVGVVIVVVETEV